MICGYLHQDLLRWKILVLLFLKISILGVHFLECIMAYFHTLLTLEPFQFKRDYILRIIVKKQI